MLKKLPTSNMVLIMLLPVLILSSVFGANLYVDDVSYYIDWTASGFYGTIPQPSAEWRLADGLDWDTTSAGVYRNYGDSTLATGLTDVSQPGLSESIIAPHQSAAAFDGVNDYLQIDDGSILNVSVNHFSLFALFRSSTTDAAQRGIVGKYNPTLNNRSYALIITNTGYLRVYVSKDGSNISTSTDATTDLNTGKWHYGGFTWAGDKLRLFLDGVQVDSTVYADSIFSGTGKFEVGTWQSSPNGWLGDIALAQVWKGTALTGVQVDSLNDAMFPTGAVSIPYPSWQSAVHQATAGDVIYGKAGRYQETVSITKNITFAAFDSSFGNRPEFYGAGLPSTSGVTALTVQDASWFSYLDIRSYYKAAGGAIYADSVSDNSLFDHIVVDSCLIGFRFRGSANSDSVFNCTLDGASLAGGVGFQEINGSAGTLATLRVKNNIVVNYATGVDTVKDGNTTFTWDGNYNCFYNVSATDIAIGINSLSVNPRYRVANDYRPNNPRLNARGLTWRVYSVPDLGAWGFNVSLSYDARLAWASKRWGRAGWGGR